MAKRSGAGLKFLPHFLPSGGDPYKGIAWTRRDAEIRDVAGRLLFRQEKVEVPATWSQLATDIAASKYFRRRRTRARRGTQADQEYSVRQLFDRVVATIAEYGREQGYFADPGSAEVFAAELKALLVRQVFSFNSPVYFNCGLWHQYGVRGSSRLWRYDLKKKQVSLTSHAYEFPQTSACFILSLEDNLESIFELAKTEARIFKFGSGCGTNFSNLRARDEPLESGGVSSGVLAFLEVLDRGAGATKSGGTTRRAAKMVVLDVDHPEILEFVRWKAHEEEKARVLLNAGYSGGLDGEAYRSVSGQNSNNSVRVGDEFMRAVLENGEWVTKARLSGAKVARFKARELWQELVMAAWRCADPGVQFHDTINRWHTCPESGEIRASNPCAEYMFVDDSACNLASLNLVKFLTPEGAFDGEGFRRAVRLVFTAQEILVGLSAYPTAKVAENSAKLRPLGIGFANLGGLLMRLGIAYDSERGRALAGAIASLMSATAYETSAELAAAVGPFNEFRSNRSAMLKVIRRHRQAAVKLKSSRRREAQMSADEVLDPLLVAGLEAWESALSLGARHGYRNSQASAIAPTGTIGLFMDCETTGIEPDFSLVKEKHLVGGGVVKIINAAVEPGLRRLGYADSDISELLRVLERDGSFLHHPRLRAEHRSIFVCAQPVGPGGEFLSSEAHLAMMAAVQPFISGAISKTVNLPAEATVEDVDRVYRRAWELGLKAIAIYRDSAKAAQPLVAAPVCSQCGARTVRSGNCFKCLACGHSESCG